MFKEISKKIAVLLSVFLLLSLQTAGGTEQEFTPWDFNLTKQEKPAAEAKMNAGSAALVAAVRFYQNHLSSVMGRRCPMYPSCSAYSIEAFKKHGLFAGIMMTADRLIHESNETAAAPQVMVNGEIRFFDPVAGNDFWWYKAAEKDGLGQK